MAATAMASLTLSAANRVTTNLGLPKPTDVLIEAGDATVVVQCLGGGFTLSAVFG